MKVGVLALQGDFASHARVLSGIGVHPLEVRTVTELDGVDGLVIPGGESTTIRLLATSGGLVEPLRERARDGMPILGTCAGLIACAATIEDPEPPIIGCLDVAVRRNAYGRQVESFETDLEVTGVGAMRAVFIRAPQIVSVGPDVEILARHRDRPVVVRQGRIVGAAFHPEIAGDGRLHALAFNGEAGTR